MIKRKIYINSKNSREIFEANLKKGINSEFEFFPNSILWGKIENHKVSGVINPPASISDPFRNRAKGLISEDNNKTKIEITVKFGLVNWIVVFLWYLPLFFILKQEKNQEIEVMMNIIIGMTLFSLFCVLLLYLKMIWDTNRLKNWIELNC